MTDEPPSRDTFRCEKCGHSGYEVGELRGAGGFLGKIFDVQRQRFTTVTCSECRYTEIYRGDANLLEDVLDFFTR